MHETAEITSFVSNINPGVDIIWGATIDDSLGEKVKITILAAGFDVELREEGNNIDFIKPMKESKEGDSDSNRIKKAYDIETMEGMHRQRYVVLNVESMDDDSIIEDIETNPTYNREKKLSEDLRSRIMNLAEGRTAKESQSKPNDKAATQEGQVVSFMG